MSERRDVPSTARARDVLPSSTPKDSTRTDCNCKTPDLGEAKCYAVPPVILKKTTPLQATSFKNVKTNSSRPLGMIRHDPYSLEWTLERLHDDTPSRALAALHTWSHPRRTREVSHATVSEIAEMKDGQAREALEELKIQRSFVKGEGKSKLTIEVELRFGERLETLEPLIDSGCEGSCIHRDVVDHRKLPTKKPPRSIPVFNADGEPNAGGPITECVVAKMRVCDHEETILFGVTDLGSGEIFLGHDWLSKHDPDIRWSDGTICLDRCKCSGQAPSVSIDSDPPSEEEYLEDGDRVPLVDFAEASKIRSVSPAQRLAEEERQRTQKTPTSLPTFLSDYADVFEKKEFDKLPPRRPWDHAIELVPGTEHKLDCKIYPLGRGEQEKLDEFLDEQLRTGRIRPSKSPMASSFFFIKKKDGSLRPVQDYRKLKSLYVPKKYTLSIIAELIDRLQRAKWYTKLDVRWGYNNVRIKEGDEYKAAFRTNRGLFEPLVMFFGLTNSPATFQNMMNDILKEEIDSGTVLVYIDDILIFGHDQADHRRQVRRVLDILRKHHLCLKLEKCEFEAREMEYLGVVVSEGEVRMDAIKTRGVGEWAAPRGKRG